MTNNDSISSSKTSPIPVRVVVLTLDRHVDGAIDQARRALVAEIPGLDLRLHSATSFCDSRAVDACTADLLAADIIFANMLFLEDHIRAVLPALEARREACDALVCAMSAGEVMRLTRMGAFRMDTEASGPMALLKKLRGKKSGNGGASLGGKAQLAMLRRIPKILRLVPSAKAHDVRTYLLTLSYWLSGSSDNIADLIRTLVNRYADGPRRPLRGTLNPTAPREYPEIGLYHPRLSAPLGMTESPQDLPQHAAVRGTVGLILMRSYLLSGDARHYDCVIEKLEARGLRVIPTFASGLDARPAIERFFLDQKTQRPIVDAVVSLTGFSLVGGPAFNDAKAAEEMLARLDVPYLAAQPLEFQTIAEWRGSPQGFTPVEATIMVAIPEIDGATNPIVFGGREERSGTMVGIDDRVAQLADRTLRLIQLRKTPAFERNVAIVLFNFPPNGGATGTAAYLSVFESLHKTLSAMKAEGYDLGAEVPSSVKELQARILEGNASRYGADANVAVRIRADDHVRREEHLDAIEKQWGPAPGRQQSDGSSVFVLGAHFGRVFVGVQPSFGYEGDPMRLLFDAASGGSFAPTHAFSAFYRYVREDFGAHVVLHFGTHGALEFMPGKQAALSSACWPDRLLGDLPNIYLYAANNPSEGTIARRRAAATLVSYRTPPVSQAGLYRGLEDLRESIARFEDRADADTSLLDHIQDAAIALDLASAADERWSLSDRSTHASTVARLRERLIEVERTLIPCGLHVLGDSMSEEQRIEYLHSIAECTPLFASNPPSRVALAAIVAGKSPKEALLAGGMGRTPEAIRLFEDLARANRFLSEDHEIPGLMHALGGGFVRPAPGGDLLRNPAVLPTGRNLHGFDPFGLPSSYALYEGKEQANRLIERHMRNGDQPFPRSIAVVLWGADNIKSGGGPIAQALALIGARPRFDSYGRLSGADLIPLAELGRPRIDVLMTLSGIFRDLLPLQTRLLAEAAFLAASADEPVEQNFVRLHALEYQQKHGCDLETAALRVFSNANGAYGANVNQLVESGIWEDEDELADVYEKRKCFAYGHRAGAQPVRHEALLKSVLGKVNLAYQNLESVELGITSIDHYFDTLGGIGRAVRREKQKSSSADATVPVYIGDQTTGNAAQVRTLSEQMSLETRTRALNPKWAEAMLQHGAEGVRQIEAHVTNTLGWSATTGQVEPWVYRGLTETYVLDRAMRERLAQLNPKASLKLANRLIEATERSYWKPDEATLAALQAAGDELEDRLEGLAPPTSATTTTGSASSNSNTRVA